MPPRLLEGATAAWTGGELLLWRAEYAYESEEHPRDGFAYDPVVDRWRTTPPAPIRGRTSHVAIWTGAEMIVSLGTDTGTNAHLTEETVVIKNTGGRAVTLTGWTLRDADRHVFRFGTFRLRPGRSVTIHTGSGDDSRKHLLWGMANYV